MDKSLDEIIGESRPQPSSRAPSNRGGVNKQRTRRGAGSSSASGRNAPKPLKTVVIQNLQDNISEDDLRDLFRQVGPVVRVEIQRDGSGIRTGIAWIVYDFAQDALVAAERYNKRKAAGKVITVKRVARVGDLGASVASLGDRIGSNASGPLSRSQRRRNARKKAAAAPKPAQNRSRNATDLDAELDAYMQVDSSIPESGNSSASVPETGASAPEKAEESMIEV